MNFVGDSVGDCVGDSAAEQSGTGAGTGTDEISRHFTENMQPDIYRMSYVLCQRMNVKCLKLNGCAHA